MSSDKPANANADCVGPSSASAGSAAGCAGCPNQKLCASGAGAQVDPAIAVIAEKLKKVRHVILVLSGKGGVGKSTTTAQLAWALANTSHSRSSEETGGSNENSNKFNDSSGADGSKAETEEDDDDAEEALNEVGVLDIDLCGPSIPRMMGLVDEQVHKSGSGWSPVYAEDNLAVMSIGFMLPQTDAPVIWRGPRKNGLIKQFLMDVDWGEDGLDYLIIDTPPGTSDEHISVVQFLKDVRVDGAVVVTTPQEVAMADVRKELNFCVKTKIPVIGLIENMSHSKVPVAELNFTTDQGQDVSEKVRALLQEKCPELLQLHVTSDVFSTSGAGVQGMARKFNVPYLGCVSMR